ncbi:MAG: hypothetical protein SV775_00535 [Thermodesulfobacteriota bacterium]|nr:hypothetical protein [Thermodesulfobacteriota bacterium]
MLGLEDIRNDLDLANKIDWDMTPEEAVTLYLEWGNNWTHGNFVRSKNDVSYYFVVNTWEDPPIIFLVKRNSDEAVELAAIPLPDKVKAGFLDSVGHNKGVFGINEEIRAWLEKEMYGNG